jgi:hypothetical protein
MGRSATIAVAALVGMLLAGCTGGGFGQSGVSLPTAAGDGVQTVSDAADALDAHRSSASENARAAIGATDAVGSFVRDVSHAERVLNANGARRTRQTAQSWTADDRRIVSGSYLHLQHGFGNVTDFCQSSAGYSTAGIPSLDVTFGWQSGAFSGGARTTDDRGSATWSANAGGEIVEGSIGALSLKRAAGGSSCPLTAPAFLLDGADSADAANAFSIPISIAFHRGRFASLSVAGGTFANGESLDVTSSTSRHSVVVNGVIRNGRTRLATFRTDASGNGTLTVTSSGAQYVVADWIVVST